MNNKIHFKNKKFTLERLLFLLSIALLFNGCCDKIASFNLTQTNFIEQPIRMRKGETITFWTAIDVEFKEKPLIVYSFKFYEGTQLLFEGGVDPFNAYPKEGFKTKKTGKTTNISFKGKLEGNFKAKKDGIYTIKVHLIKNNTPNLKLRKAKITFFKK